MAIRRLFVVLFVMLALTVKAGARAPHRMRKLPTTPYTYKEINMITNVVNGEVGGIMGTVTLTYADGTQVTEDACVLHKIHARVIHNQVNSDLFPSTARSCVRQYWSTSYAATGWRSDEQWQHCRNDVLTALCGFFEIPDNVLAATCDPYFATHYTGYHLWAKVQWDTGWTHGTFYYYQYGG